MAESERCDFFISYNKADKDWAEWIAWTLEKAGYTVIIQAWDIRPGENFILKMHQATKDTDATIAVLSQNYLDAEYTKSEWAEAFAKDPEGQKRMLIPVRIRECNPEGLLKAVVYLDLVEITNEDEAREKLLDSLRSRGDPRKAPQFPGGSATESIPESVVGSQVEYPGRSEKIWNLPHERNHFFTGRVKVLSRLRHALMSPLTQHRAVISGLGGIGKTETAIEYAYRYREEYKEVLWVVAASSESLVSGFVDISALLELRECNAQDHKLAIAAVKRWLERNSGWLLVFDGADDPILVENFIPHQSDGHILLTSRATTFANLYITKPLDLDAMKPEEASGFLRKRTGRSDLHNEEVKAISKLGEKLGYLPLALEQAAAYTHEMRIGFRDYLTGYEKRGSEFLDKHLSDSSRYPQSIGTTWQLNFDQVEAASRGAADLLRLSSFLAPERIPIEVFPLASSVLPSTIICSSDPSDPLVLDDLLQPLMHYSLIRRDLESRTFSIHRLVQAVIQDMIEKDAQRQWAETAVRVLNEAFPDVDFKKWSQCDRLLPHVQRLVEIIRKWKLDLVEVPRLLNRAGDYLRCRARYIEAEPLYMLALEIYEKTVGTDHHQVAATLNNLGALYYVQGRYFDAEPFYQRAQRIVEKTPGADNSDIASSLALLYVNQGRYDEAESLYIQALKTREEVLGSDHIDVAVTLNNLAGLYTNRGQYVKAEPLLKRACVIFEKKRQPGHPDIATPINDLACLYADSGRYSEAEPLFNRALKIREHTLGKQHPDVAATLTNLGKLYTALNQHSKAEALYEQALRIYEGTLGPEHPDVAAPLEKIAVLYTKQGHYSDAKRSLDRALRIRKKAHGSNHPYVALVLRSLGEFYEIRGVYDSAESLYLSALKVFRETLVHEHSDIARTLYNLAKLYEKTDHQEKAEQSYRLSLQSFKGSLDYRHPSFLLCRRDYIAFLLTLGRSSEAERLEAEFNDKSKHS